MSLGIYVKTEEHKRKISEALKGRSPSLEIRAKISKTLTGRKNPEHSERMKGRTPWNKGLKTGPLTEEHKQKLSESNKGQIPWIKGKTHSEEVRQVISKTHSGERHHNWKGGFKKEYCPVFINKEWRSLVYKRDGNNCQLCGITSQMNFKLIGHKQLDIHHINGNKKDCDLNNCISLCSSCHTKVGHKKTQNYYKILLTRKLK